MKKHKGQSVVEFALVLPLFLFIMFGVIYTGMMFHDYATLSNIARACTREAAVSATEDYGEIAGNYLKRVRNDGLMTDFYKLADTDPIIIRRVQDETGDYIQTTINMQLKANGFFIDMIVPRAFGVRYYMQKEPIYDNQITPTQ